MRTIQKGQALLTLLVFMIVAVTITTGAIVIIFVNSQSTTKYEESQRAYFTAESGIENAAIRLLRDTTYTGETMAVDDGTATVQVSGSGPYTVVSKGKIGNFTRTIQATMSYTNNVLSVTSWKEI